jgi:serine/threonine-protein kinase
LGPIAAILVDKAAARSNSLGEFCSELAGHVESEGDRERVMALAGTKAPPAPASPPARPAASAAESSVPKDEVDRLAALLCHHLGPIATLIARRESAAATSSGDLQQRLSALIPNEGERAEFVRRAKAD